MKNKCLACGVEKDRSVLEVYPHKEDGICNEPIDPLFDLDCQGKRDENGRYVRELPGRWAGNWRTVTVCHHCFHKLSPDQWIGEEHWEVLNPVVPFEQLPLMEPDIPPTEEKGE